MFCNIHGFLWNITSRLSIFLVMVLSLTRTTFLTMPFKVINKHAVLLSILATAFSATSLLGGPGGNMFTYFVKNAFGLFAG